MGLEQKSRGLALNRGAEPHYPRVRTKKEENMNRNADKFKGRAIQSCESYIVLFLFLFFLSTVRVKVIC